MAPVTNTSREKALNPIPLSATPKISRAGHPANQARALQGDPDLARFKASNQTRDEVPRLGNSPITSL